MIVGAVHVTDTPPFDAEATTPVGTPGWPAVRWALGDHALVPRPFVPRTCTW